MPVLAQRQEQTTMKVNALFLGDSYSVGVGGTPWTNGFVYKVGEHYNWRVYNYAARAVGYLKGDTPTSWPKIRTCLSPQGCRHLQEQYEQALFDGVKPDVIVVSGGRNDDPGPTFEPAVRKLLTAIKLRSPRAQVFVTSPVNYGPLTPVMALKAEIVRRVCREQGITFIELGSPLLVHTGVLFRDQIHPNNVGYKLLADKIIRQIDASISRRTRLFSAEIGLTANPLGDR